MSLEAAIAVTRFGLGAKKGEIDKVSVNPQGWLFDQVSPKKLTPFPQAPGIKTARENIEWLMQFQRSVRRGRRSGGDPQPSQDQQREYRQKLQQIAISEVQARYLYASTTPVSFHERLVRFWSNHFSVSAINPQMTAVVGAYEREAIRPQILGSFRDLLVSAIDHPGMLIYLDNWQSVGPNSAAGRAFDRGLNENLAREILELHTLSSVGGYTQADVTEFARALTGWTVGNNAFEQDRMGEAFFFSRIHEPGTRIVMGKRYNARGRQQALEILEDLAVHPMTARHIAIKLARHFTKDDPPLTLVSRLEQVFLDTDGDLPVVYRALVEAPEPWDTLLTKLKSPEDLLISAARYFGLQSIFAGMPRETLTSLAQQPFNAPSPEGWPDTEEGWLGPDAIMKRIEWANRVAARTPDVDARQFVGGALADLASPDTVQAVRLAESGEQALAIALMSPEFQRR